MALSGPRILRAALTILDTYGLGDLTMRRVATALEVQPGTIYNHIPDKQSLLAGVADLILADVSEPLGTWRAGVEGWAASLRRVLLAHRDSAELVSTARGFQLTTHDITRHPATLLAAAGLPPGQAVVAATTCLHFILGHVAEEQARLDNQRFGARTATPSAPPTDPDLSFEFGLGLVLDGVASRL